MAFNLSPDSFTYASDINLTFKKYAALNEAFTIGIHTSLIKIEKSLSALFRMYFKTFVKITLTTNGIDKSITNNGDWIISIPDSNFTAGTKPYMIKGISGKWSKVENTVIIINGNKTIETLTKLSVRLYNAFNRIWVKSPCIGLKSTGDILLFT